MQITSSMTYSNLKKDIKNISDPERAQFLQRFFKTKEGEYGHGDKFLGFSVPQARAIAAKYNDLSLSEIETLLKSPYHEERLIALFILVALFKRAEPVRQKTIYNFYLSHTMYVNNWDLVDSSADKIVGEYLWKNGSNLSILKKLAKSNLLWERRIAMIATFQYLKHGDSSPTYEIADMLLMDKHDLIQKAVGWMLRETGKKVSEKELVEFLKPRYKLMPRTTLRYAIEKFPEKTRKAYLAGTV